MGWGWPSGPGWGYGLGAWGQGGRWRRLLLLLLLLLVHLLEVLLPGPHLRVLQLLHVEGLPVGQELLPLVLQLPMPMEHCYQAPEDPWASALPPTFSFENT